MQQGNKSRSRLWRNLGVTIVIIGALLAAFGVWRQSNVRQQDSQALHTLVRGNLQRFVTGTGRVAAINRETVVAQSGGQIGQLPVAVGTVVEKGELLMRMADGRVINAPRQGEVTSLFVRANEWVNPGARLLEITDFDNLEVVAQVDELDIAKLSLGQEVAVDIIALQGENVTGQITFLGREGVVTGGVTAFAVRVSLPNPENILVGMSAEIRIETARAVDVLIVPVQAVFFDGDQALVYLQGDNNLRERQKVVVGLSDGIYVEIKQGLEQGQVVAYEKPIAVRSPNMPGPLGGR
ncbi:MAG: HlyD family efflux transporter periplasmic adaptor subunit [Peptococcaceae bacterium]|nr:HlyD family efflux transporter periplasmic adaptor subunit [Peptococcaceae bacterium]